MQGSKPLFWCSKSEMATKHFEGFYQSPSHGTQQLIIHAPFAHPRRPIQTPAFPSRKDLHRRCRRLWGREKKPETDLWRRRSRCNADIAPHSLELQGTKYPEILLTLLLLPYYTRHPPIAGGRWKWRFGLPVDPHHVMFVVKVNLKTT